MEVASEGAALVLQYEPTDIYYACVKVYGKLVRRKLNTNVYSKALLRLSDFLKENNAALPHAVPMPLLATKFTDRAGLDVFLDRNPTSRHSLITEQADGQILWHKADISYRLSCNVHGYTVQMTGPTMVFMRPIVAPVGRVFATLRPFRWDAECVQHLCLACLAHRTLTTTRGRAFENRVNQRPADAAAHYFPNLLPASAE